LLKKREHHLKVFSGEILSSPVVAGDTVYFGSTDGNLYALIQFTVPRSNAS